MNDNERNGLQKIIGKAIDDLPRELAVHPVTWSRKDSFCEDQYADVQPVELPTAPSSRRTGRWTARSRTRTRCSSGSPPSRTTSGSLCT